MTSTEAFPKYAWRYNEILKVRGTRKHAPGNGARTEALLINAPGLVAAHLIIDIQGLIRLFCSASKIVNACLVCQGGLEIPDVREIVGRENVSDVARLFAGDMEPRVVDELAGGRDGEVIVNVVSEAQGYSYAPTATNSSRPPSERLREEAGEAKCIQSDARGMITPHGKGKGREKGGKKRGAEGPPVQPSPAKNIAGREAMAPKISAPEKDGKWQNLHADESSLKPQMAPAPPGPSDRIRSPRVHAQDASTLPCVAEKEIRKMDIGRSTDKPTPDKMNNPRRPDGVRAGCHGGRLRDTH